MTAPAPSLRAQLAHKKRVLTAAFVGTGIEWYDFYLYGAVAGLVFNRQFFPDESTLAGTIASYAVFASGFLARPLGGAIAGHLGDQLGRKGMLAASLVTMGLASTLIGLLPTYESIGMTAVVLLVLLRLVQGLSSGAEWGGSAVLTVEHAPASARGLFGSFTQVGSAVGMLMATGTIALIQALLSPEQFLAWGWRIPFLASLGLVAFGLYIRLGVADSDEFRNLQKDGRVQRAPIKQVIRHHRRALLVTIGLRLAQPGLFAILAVYTINYLAERRGDTTTAVTAVAMVSAVGLLSGVVWGRLSDKWGRRRISIVATTGIAVFIWPYFWFLDAGSLVFLPLVMAFGMNILHDAVYGPQAAWFAEQFPVEVRYTGVSLGYQVGTVISGGLTPVIAVSLLALGGQRPWLICGYITVLCALSLWASIAARDPVVDGKSDDAAGSAGGETGLLVGEITAREQVAI